MPCTSVKYWKLLARIIVYSTSLILTGIFFFAKARFAVILGFAEGSGLLYLPCLKGDSSVVLLGPTLRAQ